MPNGRSIVLERQQGADTGGHAGLEDGVDQHWGELFKAALLSTSLGIATELGSGFDPGNDSNAIQALRRRTGDALNQTGQQVVRRNLNIQPTLTIRPGFPVRVIINRDLLLEPYRAWKKKSPSWSSAPLPACQAYCEFTRERSSSLVACADLLAHETG